MASTVLVSKSSSRAGFPILIAAILVVYLLGRVIEVLPFSTPSTPIVAIEILSALAFAVVHGSRVYGVHGMLVFAAMCLGVGGAMETMGVGTGFPYGHYQFLPLMGPQVLRVPVLLGLAYIGMAYVSWMVARLIVGATVTRIADLRGLLVPLVASVVMTAWDLAQDPVWSTLLHAWRWRDGGAWFGVPLSNYAGWLLTVLLIYAAFGIYLARTPSIAGEARKTDGRAAIVFYAACAAGNVLQMLRPQAQAVVADPTGRLWHTAAILRASAAVSICVMGGFAMLAWMRVRRMQADPIRD